MATNKVIVEPTTYTDDRLFYENLAAVEKDGNVTREIISKSSK